jgi:hypothetical protein
MGLIIQFPIPIQQACFETEDEAKKYAKDNNIKVRKFNFGKGDRVVSPMTRIE